MPSNVSDFHTRLLEKPLPIRSINRACWKDIARAPHSSSRWKGKRQPDCAAISQPFLVIAAGTQWRTGLVGSGMGAGLADARNDSGVAPLHSFVGITSSDTCLSPLGRPDGLAPVANDGLAPVGSSLPSSHDGNNTCGGYEDRKPPQQSRLFEPRSQCVP